MTNWWNEYVGIRYLSRGRSNAGLDCYGLLIKVYKEQFSIELEDYLYGTEGSPKEIGQLFDTSLGGPTWVPVEDSALSRKVGDVAIFSLMTTPFHSVILINRNYMLHCTTGSGVVVERISSSWGRRMVGVFRHEQMWSDKS